MAKKKTNAEKLSTAYLKAYKRFNDLKKEGFIFDKRTEKMFSAESFETKTLKPTKKNIERYKSLTKSSLYKKAKGFYDIDKNAMFSVNQGKKVVRKRKAEEKAHRMESSNRRIELFQKLKDIDSKFFDIAEQKNEVLFNYSNFVLAGNEVTQEMITKIDGKIEVITYSSKQEIVNDAFDSINSMLTGGASYSDGGNMSLIGTPYENV